MALKTSGTVIGNITDYRESNAYNYGGQIIFNWELVSQSHEYNTSSVKWEIKLKFNNSSIIVSFDESELYALEPEYAPDDVGSVGGFISAYTQLFRTAKRYSAANGLEQVIGSGIHEFNHDLFGGGDFSLYPSFTCFYDDEDDTRRIYMPAEYFTLPVINREVIINAPNFNDEENPTVLLDTPADAWTLKVCISFDGKTDAIPWRYIDVRASGYTFKFTDKERETLFNTQLGEPTKKVYFMAEVFYWEQYGEEYDYIDENGKNWGENTVISQQESVLTVIGCMPTVSPIVEDTNETTLALTGNKDTIVKYFSNAEFTTNAAASKGATLTHQSASCAGKTYSNVPTGVFTGAESGTFVFTASDSRDLIVSQVVEKNFIDYVKLTCNLETGLPKLEGYIPFTISGNYFNGSFGAVSNTLSVKFRYQVNDGDFSPWLAVTPTINTTNRTYTYSRDLQIPNFNYKDSFVIEAGVLDKLISLQVTGDRVKTLPVFDWSAEDFNFNVPVNFAETANISVDEDTSRLNINNEGGIALNENVSINGNGELLLSGTKLNGIINALTRRYHLPCEVYVGELYSDVSVDLYLYGNTIRGYMSTTRKTNVAAGNIANEYVCQVDFDSGGKVTGFGAVSFGSGGEGGLASWVMTNTNVYPDDGSVDESQVGKGSFQIRLNATGTAGNTFSGYFCFPALLDLNKF